MKPAIQKLLEKFRKSSFQSTYSSKELSSWDKLPSSSFSLGKERYALCGQCPKSRRQASRLPVSESIGDSGYRILWLSWVRENHPGLKVTIAPPHQISIEQNIENPSLIAFPGEGGSAPYISGHSISGGCMWTWLRSCLF